MICRHKDCGQPVERCHGGASHRRPHCAGYVHSATGYHRCHLLYTQCAEPEPRQPAARVRPGPGRAGEGGGVGERHPRRTEGGEVGDPR